MTEATNAAAPRRDLADPRYRAAVVELLGLLANGELSTFARLAHDSTFAPSLPARIALSGFAVEDHGHFLALSGRIAALGADTAVVLEPFTGVFDEFNARTVPGDWWEHLTKAYVAYGVANDFGLELADFLDDETRDLVTACLTANSYELYVIDELSAAIAADPTLGARLALWGRRLVGEALGLAQGAITRFHGLTYLIAQGRSDGEPGDVTRIITRLTEGHTRRMDKLKLTA